ncbi:UNVERIFIED_CONTAM: hypothetical protein HDU68_001154 [Siphonaria sp. JEL0065]|nr:hypothetical protein HDU68_001154 [Siphonaria sp. JEL0065]
MDGPTNQVLLAYSKAEDESTWSGMDKALSGFIVAIQSSSSYNGVDALRRIKACITQSLLSPRSALQKTAITLLVTSASSLGPSFTSNSIASDHLTSLLQLCSKASAVMVRLAWNGIESIIASCGGSFALAPFVSLCCQELKKGNKASKPLRIIAVDSVKCVLEGMRADGVDASKIADIVQDVLRMAIGDSANEVRDAGRRLFSEFTQSFPDKVDKFTASLSPQHLKSLNLKPSSIPSKPSTPSSAIPTISKDEINRAKQQFREKQEQEFQRLQFKKLQQTLPLPASAKQPSYTSSESPEPIIETEYQPRGISFPQIPIRGIPSKRSRISFLSKSITHRDSIDDHLHFDLMGQESLLDGELPPNFVDDDLLDQYQDDNDGQLDSGTPWTAGFVNAIAYTIPLDSDLEEDGGDLVIAETSPLARVAMDLNDNYGRSDNEDSGGKEVNRGGETMEDAMDILEGIIGNSSRSSINGKNFAIDEASEEDISALIQEIKDLEDSTILLDDQQSSKDSPMSVAFQILHDDSKPLTTTQQQTKPKTAPNPVVLTPPLIPSTLHNPVATPREESRAPTPSSAALLDETSHDIITTLNVTYTMTLEEEVAAAEAAGKRFSQMMDHDPVVDLDEEVELDPDFVWSNDEADEESKVEMEDGEENDYAEEDIGNVSVEVLSTDFDVGDGSAQSVNSVEPVETEASTTPLEPGNSTSVQQHQPAPTTISIFLEEIITTATSSSPIPSLGTASIVETVATPDLVSTAIEEVAANPVSGKTSFESENDVKEAMNVGVDHEEGSLDDDAATVGEEEERDVAVDVDDDDADTVISDSENQDLVADGDDGQHRQQQESGEFSFEVDKSASMEQVDNPDSLVLDVQDSSMDVVEFQAVSTDGVLETMTVVVEELAEGMVPVVPEGSLEPNVVIIPESAHDKVPSATMDSILTIESDVKVPESLAKMEEVITAAAEPTFTTSPKPIPTALSMPDATKSPRTSFLPMSRVRSLPGTPTLAPTKPTSIPTVRRQQTMTSLPKQQQKPQQPTPSQMPPPSISRTSSLKQKQTTLPRPLSVHGYPSPQQSPKSTPTVPASSFSKAGSTTPTPPHHSFIKKSLAQIPPPRGSPSPSSSSAGSASSTPPSSPRMPTLSVTKPTTTSLAFKPTSTRSGLAKSTSNHQLGVSSSGSKLVPIGVRRPSQVIRVQSEPVAPIKPLTAALSKRVEQASAGGLTRPLTSTSVIGSPSTVRRSGVMTPTVSSSLKQQVSEPPGGMSVASAKPIVETSSLPSFRPKSPKGPTSPHLANSMISSSILAPSAPASLGRRPTPPVIRTNSSRGSTPRTTPITTPVLERVPTSTSTSAKRAKQVSWSQDLAVILGTSENENYQMQLENQVSDAIMGGVDSVWELLEAYGGVESWELEAIKMRVEDLIGAVLKDLGDEKKRTPVFIKRGLGIFRSALETKGTNLPSDSLTQVLKCVLQLAATAEGTDDVLEIEYEVAGTLETIESIVGFSVLSQVISSVLDEMKPTDGSDSGWVSGQRTCYEMLARTLESVVLRQSGDGSSESSNASVADVDGDWEVLTVHVVEVCYNMGSPFPQF